MKTGISRSVQLALQSAGKSQRDLAQYTGYSEQAMSNKSAANSWTASDLARVAEFINGRLVLICPDRLEITIKPASGPFHHKKPNKGEKKNRSAVSKPVKVKEEKAPKKKKDSKPKIPVIEGQTSMDELLFRC